MRRKLTAKRPNTKCQELMPKIKWASYQEAVTFPWLPAHSILKWIGGDTYMLDPLPPMSSLFQSSQVAICSPRWSKGAFQLSRGHRIQPGGGVSRGKLEPRSAPKGRQKSCDEGSRGTSVFTVLSRTRTICTGDRTDLLQPTITRSYPAPPCFLLFQ